MHFDEMKFHPDEIKGTYFDNFQSAAFESPTMDRLENGTDADQMQSGIAVAALKETTLRVFSLISVQHRVIRL